MITPLATDRRRRLGAGAALVLAAVYAGWASGAPPFGVAADVLISVPAAAFAGALVAQARWPSTGPWRRLPPLRPVPRSSAAPWVVAVVVVAAVEVASYFLGAPRTTHPTISSALDALFRVRGTKAAAYLGWLCAGWYLVRR